MNPLSYINRKIRYIKLKKKNVFIDKSYVDNNTVFGGNNIISRKCVIRNCSIGVGTYIQDNCFLNKTKIGKWCSIASNVRIVSGNHPTKTFVSTHPLFYSSNGKGKLKFLSHNLYDEYSYVDSEQKYYCEIGNDVWIGDNVLILNGVKIGDGAIIAAGAVVTKNVEPYSIYGGVPAKYLGSRFNSDEIKKLLNVKWWNKSIDWLNENASSFASITSLLEALNDN